MTYPDTIPSDIVVPVNKAFNAVIKKSIAENKAMTMQDRVDLMHVAFLINDCEQHGATEDGYRQYAHQDTGYVFNVYLPNLEYADGERDQAHVSAWTLHDIEEETEIEIDSPAGEEEAEEESSTTPTPFELFGGEESGNTYKGWAFLCHDGHESEDIANQIRWVQTHAGSNWRIEIQVSYDRKVSYVHITPSKHLEGKLDIKTKSGLNVRSVSLEYATNKVLSEIQ